MICVTIFCLYLNTILPQKIMHILKKTHENKTYLFILFKNMMNIFRAIFRTLTKIDDGAFYDNTQQFYVLLTVFTKGLHPLMMKIIISKLVVLILLFAISTYRLHHLISSRTHCLQSFSTTLVGYSEPSQASKMESFREYS